MVCRYEARAHEEQIPDLDVSALGSRSDIDTLSLSGSLQLRVGYGVMVERILVYMSDDEMVFC